MSAFLIYAIILTLAYIIYYSAMITRELYSKKGQQTDTTETFAVADAEEPITSVEVNESKDSFYIGETVPETMEENPEELQTPLQQDAASIREEPSEAEQHAVATEKKMDDIQADYEDAMFAEEFACSLLNSNNSVPVVICNDVRDEL